MTKYNIDILLRRLQERTITVIAKVFRPLGFIMPFAGLDKSVAEQFQLARTLFNMNRHSEARDVFLDIQKRVNISQNTIDFAVFNAAACMFYLDLENEVEVIELLRRYFERGKLYGPPLWNLALAYYRQGYLHESIACISTWTARSNKDELRGRGELLLSALLLKQNNSETVPDHLNAALEANENLVAQLLQIPLSEIALANQTKKTLASLTMEQWKRLAQLAIPKKPDRGPLISNALQLEDLETYNHALEVLAEGDFDKAYNEIEGLRQIYPNIIPLTYAIAAIFLMDDRLDDAHSLYIEAQNTGHTLTSNALWNLSCVYIRQRDQKKAIETLELAKQTEFRTKPELLIALRELTGATYLAPQEQSDSVLPIREVPLKPNDSEFSMGVLDNLSVALPSAQLEVLSRLVRPTILAKSYLPDIRKLIKRDQQRIVEAISYARGEKTKTDEAISILLSLLEDYPAIYTIKVHAAGYLIRQRQFDRAKQLLQGAQKMRPLDTLSRFNLAYVHLQEGNIRNVYETLHQEPTPSNADYRYWLAVAIAFALNSQQKKSSMAAARALQLSSGAIYEVTAATLKRLQIEPDVAISTSESLLGDARQALNALNKGKVAETTQLLGRYVESLTDIPEFNRNVLIPRFLNRSPASWSRELTDGFEQAVRLYSDGEFMDAAEEFRKLQRPRPIIGFDINAVAALIRANAPSAAIELAQKQIKKYPRRKRSLPLPKLAYNYTIACYQLNDIETALQVADPYSASYDFSYLMPLLYTRKQDDSAYLDQLAFSLEKLKERVGTPSRAYLMAFAWAMLKKSMPDVQKAGQALRSVIDTQDILPAVEVINMQQVRLAYERFALLDTSSDAIAYMQTIVETKRQERDGLETSQDNSIPLQNGIGVELIARASLARFFKKQNERELALGQLASVKEMLDSYGNDLPVGFRVKDWVELAKLADELTTPWIQQYCLEQIERDEPDNTTLQLMKNALDLPSLNEACEAIRIIMTPVLNAGADVPIASDAIRRQLKALSGYAPLFSRALSTLIKILQGNQPNDNIDDMEDRVRMLGSLEMPQVLLPETFSWLNRLMAHYRRETVLDFIEIEVVADQIRVRIDDDHEATCLLSISSPNKISSLTVLDSATEQRLWSGDVELGQKHYFRWTIYNNDGYPDESYMDLSLTLTASDGNSSISSQITLNVIIRSGDPSWPSYPAGALTPNDVPLDEQLYGRKDLLTRILRTLGKNRTSETFFLEAPRQMGKTSLLNFVKKQCPAHVLPVYVNLELSWTTQDPDHHQLWNYLVQRVRHESGEMEIPVQLGQTVNDLLQTATAVCERAGKNYVLLILDEFHEIFDKLDSVGEALAQFRGFLNTPENRISLLIADRYTVQELERRQASDYWGQLSIEQVGPLNFESAKRAIEMPARGTDLTFLPETLKWLYTVTAGYPYHLQRAVNNVLSKMYTGPWLTVLPEDIDEIASSMIQQDSLFQLGLCRKDRITSELADAITALLEWHDLIETLPTLLTDVDTSERSLLERWKPELKLFLTRFSNQDQILETLSSIGVLSKDKSSFFSPLLERWLLNMRQQGKTISSDPDWKPWQGTEIDGIDLSPQDWQNLDTDLIRQTKAIGKPPLNEKAFRTDEWAQLIMPVTSQTTFETFLGAMFDIFIDGRSEKSVLPKYPWLYWVYHRTRLIRNFFVHQPPKPNAIAAWNYVCLRALGGEYNAYRPDTTEEWEAIHTTMLRSLHAALQNTIEIARQR